MLTFDPAKDAKNIRKHGISLARFNDMREDTMLVIPDVAHSTTEERFIVIGFIDAGLYVAAVTYRGADTRVISLRRASRKERTLYDQTQGGNRS